MPLPLRFVSVLLVRASPLSRIAYVLLAITTLAALLSAFRVSRGAERTCLVWGLVAGVAGESIPIAPFAAISAACWFVTPAILTYSLLNRRLFDIGFIVNRAAVFTAVSVAVLGTFVLVEWLLSDWLRDASIRQTF